MYNRPPARLWSKLGLAASLMLFIGLAMAVEAGTTLPFDEFVRKVAHREASNFLTALAFAFSFLGSLLVLVFLTLVALAGFLFVGERRSALALGSAMAGSIVLNNALKFGFHRMRPDSFFGVDPETYSFPSGHVLFSTCFYGVVAMLLLSKVQNFAARTVIWSVIALLLLFIGWSRIYLGVHYPTDVVGGLLVAIFWITALHSLGLMGFQPEPLVTSAPDL